MPSINDLKDQLYDITTFRLISSAFTEASAARIKKIRAAFEQNKDFYREISHVYHLVQKCAAKAKKSSTKGEKASAQDAPRKILTVALTSNQHFYGNINVNIMREFFQQSAKINTELYIIGKTGNDLARAMGKGRPYAHTVFAKESPSEAEALVFLEYIKSYDSVYLYYPKFISLMTQTVGILDITQAESEDQVSEAEIKILFEPELTRILEFFNRQVRSLLFLRVLLEADLSRTAARLMSMSAAEERSDKLAKEKKRELRKVLASLINRQLLDTFAGMTKWKKH